ncbi:MAG TPA: CDP-alcohol phosphatidyltransferase family protein [Candidatus Saccharimonadaceae bacterium]|nr:CDP-alcohol phosphatidyltransferase family protein [Candidatus Saccharimonadaceae bacterium]
MSEAPVAEPPAPPKSVGPRVERVERPSEAAPRRPGALSRLKERLRVLAHGALDPIVRGLARAGVRANHLTVLGLGLSAAAALAFYVGETRLGALVLSLAGVCDILDGQLARASGGETRFGAFFDSTLDRLSEALVLIGIFGFCLRNLLALVLDPERVINQANIGLNPETWAFVGLLAVIGLTGSFLVSYTRARAEGLGLECKVGWFERPERMVLIILAGVLHVFWAISAALLLLAVFSFVTAAQRVAHVYRLTRTP